MIVDKSGIAGLVGLSAESPIITGGGGLSELFSSLVNGNSADGTGVGSAAAGATSDSMDPKTQEALNMLKDMTDGGMQGYWKWMMKQIRQKVMDEMGVTEASLAAMKPDQRAAVEKQIEDEVKRRLAKAMGLDGTGKDAKAQADAAQAGNGSVITPVTQAEKVAAVEPAAKTEAAKAYKDKNLIPLF